MKKWLIGILSGFCALASIVGFSACGHTHTFDEEITESAYQATQATCTEKATYYYSCECGEKGTETFEYGEVLAHPTENKWIYTETHHWRESTCDCDIKVAYSQHTLEDSGYCTVCDQPIGTTVGVLYDLSADGTYAEVIGYDGMATRIVIADTYNDLPVKSIYHDAFYNNKSITSILIPGSVEGIGEWAFAECENLMSVVVGDGVKSIGDWAFAGCESLMSVTIGDGVERIGSGAFYNCFDLEEINYMGSIDDWAQINFAVYYNSHNDPYSYATPNESNPLYYAKKLYINDELVKEINITTATKISACAFYGYRGLTGVEIGSSVTSIGYQAFCWCDRLMSVAIGGSLTSVDEDAFWGCTSLMAVTIGDGVTSIGSSAFAYCSSLTSVTVGDSVESIGKSAFSNCDDLTNVTIGESVTIIGASAFRNCNSLKYTTYGNCKYLGTEDNPYFALIGLVSDNYRSYQLHEDTKVIADFAFSGCARLAEVYYKGAASEWDTISIGDNNSQLTDATRYYYVENEADVPTDGGNYWHYVDGVPTKWVIE